MHSPTWVLKNKISSMVQAAVNNNATNNLTISLSKNGSKLEAILKIVVLLINDRLELFPIANRLTE